jgi:hypothetical protein
MWVLGAAHLPTMLVTLPPTMQPLCSGALREHKHTSLAVLQPQQPTTCQMPVLYP